MNQKNNEIERPVLGYVVIAVAVLTGMITASAFGQHDEESVAANVNVSEVKSNLDGVMTSSHRRWVLGVGADATQTGYLIQHVEESSAAANAGLETGDRIVAINGKQVGYVDAGLVSLAKTLDQVGGSNGRVEILIQNRRNRRLVSLQVVLRSPFATLGH